MSPSMKNVKIAFDDVFKQLNDIRPFLERIYDNEPNYTFCEYSEEEPFWVQMHDLKIYFQYKLLLNPEIENEHHYDLVNNIKPFEKFFEKLQSQNCFDTPTQYIECKKHLEKLAARIDQNNDNIMERIIDYMEENGLKAFASETLEKNSRETQEIKTEESKPQ